MTIPESIVPELETPCVIIDVAHAQRNVEAMQQAADAAGVALRPHIKTHKMPFFTRMQLDAGAAGITCAKVSEAEVMADGGADDIFIAYPLVGAFRLKRAIALARRVRRLILAVDSLAGATALNDAALEAGLRLEVRLELDTGAKRTGAPLDDCAVLAAAIAALPQLELTGIYTFKSLNYHGELTDDNDKAAAEEGQLLQEAAAAIKARGVHLREISGGSSPTGLALARTGDVSEIRPGTYIFNDQLLCREGVATPADIAVRFAATVVSTPRDDYAIIDGGTKCFPTDIPLNSAPFFFTGYAQVEGKPHLTLSRMNEEHGIITSASGSTGLSVGERLTLIPIHVCTAINMQNTVYLLEHGTVRKEAVAARGMLI